MMHKSRKLLNIVVKYSASSVPIYFVMENMVSGCLIFISIRNSPDRKVGLVPSTLESYRSLSVFRVYTVFLWLLFNFIFYCTAFNKYDNY